MKAFLLKTIQDAGKYALQYFEKLDQVDVMSKGERDLVTEADIAVEQFLKERLQTEFPDFGFFGEESGQTSGSAGRWIVDPIDGTLSFARGQHYWSISIGVEVNGALQMGAVYGPVLDRLYFAEKGQGATKNGKTIQVSETSELVKSVGATGFACVRSHQEPNNLNRFLRATEQMQGVRVQGSAALDLCMVADGTLDVFWEQNLNLYDVAAGAVIVEEAGGRLSDFSGNPGLFPQETMGCNVALQSNFLQLLAETPS